MTARHMTFGFVDYFIMGSKRRLPVEFVQQGTERFARLDSAHSSPVLVHVDKCMRPEVVGDFPAVLDKYKSESEGVICDKRFWTECMGNGASILRLFRILHHMRFYGISLEEALIATRQLEEMLLESEEESTRLIRDIVLTGALDAPMPKTIVVRPHHAPTGSPLFSLA